MGNFQPTSEQEEEEEEDIYLAQTMNNSIQQNNNTDKPTARQDIHVQTNTESVQCVRNSTHMSTFSYQFYGAQLAPFQQIWQ